jgi:hypothetical protein
MKDQMLFCVQCDEAFMYSVKEQMRHLRQGFDPPRRCPECRQHKVKLTGDEDAPRGERRGQKRARRMAEE